MTKLRRPDGDGGNMKEPLVIELLIIGLIVILFLLIGVVLISRVYAAVGVMQMLLHAVNISVRNAEAIRAVFANVSSYSGLWKS